MRTEKIAHEINSIRHIILACIICVRLQNIERDRLLLLNKTVTTEKAYHKANAF